MASTYLSVTGHRQKQLAEQEGVGNPTNGSEGTQGRDSLRQDQTVTNDQNNDSDGSFGNLDVLDARSGHAQMDDDFIEFLNITCPRSPLPAMDWHRSTSNVVHPNSSESPHRVSSWYSSIQTQRPATADSIKVAARTAPLQNDSVNSSIPQIPQPLTCNSNATMSLDRMGHTPLDDIFENSVTSKNASHQHDPPPRNCEREPDIRRDSANCCSGKDAIDQQQQHLFAPPGRSSRYHANVSNQEILRAAFRV